ncbi:MAG: zinc ribbon domain-containing protein [Betaproteobacteria bacterium]|nr:zinc ribbon domain-containing protein [Betaproteobacteria bacterium]
MIVLAVVLLPALAAVPSGRGAPKGNPRLASLQIEIWPEFDRPAALVILKGELAADVALPAAVSLRISASSGGPAAVAYANAAKTGLFNLKYDRADAGDFITLRFEVPERFFHVEFYDPIKMSTPDRSYTYAWSGDLAADRLSVILQEPAAASNISVQPGLEGTATGQEGLRYRSAELGAFEVGKQLPIRIRYTKTDSRTSAEILKLKAPQASPSPAAGSGQEPVWLLVVIAAAALLAGGGAAFLWWRRSAKASGPQPGGAAFCTKCGNRLGSGDRFCARCGTQVG